MSLLDDAVRLLRNEEHIHYPSHPQDRFCPTCGASFAYAPADGHYRDCRRKEIFERYQQSEVKGWESEIEN